MNNKKLLSLMTLALSVLMLGSCGLLGEQEVNRSYVQAIAYQVEGDSLYGMMNLNGEVICKPQFKKEPTEASCDRFFVQGDDDLWELYTLEPNPKAVNGKKYYDVGAFVEGLCPVTEPNSYPKYINVEGEVVIEAKEYEGKKIIQAHNFLNGMAVVRTEDDLYGYMDRNGVMVIPPKYALARSFYTENALADLPLESGKSEESQNWVILDKSGNEVFKTRKSKMNRELVGFEPNNLTVVSMKDGEKFALINNKGEKVCTLDIKDVKSFYGDLVKFQDDDLRLGLMDTEGKVVIEPDYSLLKYCGGPIIAQDKEDDEYYLLDRQGNEVKTISAHHIWVPDESYIGYKDRILCFPDSSKCYFLDGQGNRLPSSIEFSTPGGKPMAVANTDYQVAELLMKKVELTSESMMGSKLGDSYINLKEPSNPLLKGERDYEMEEDSKTLAFNAKYIGREYAHIIHFDKDYIDDNYDDNPNAKVDRLVTIFESGQHTEKMLEMLKQQAEKMGTFFKKMLLMNVEGDAYKLSDNRFLFFGPSKDKEVILVYLGD